jgi:hypothetical protein
MCRVCHLLLIFFFVDLHPLALEDVLNGNPHTRSKADYYSRHLFLRVLCHDLAADDQSRPAEVDTQSLDISEISSLEGEEVISDESKNGDPLANSNLKQRKFSILPTHFREARTGYRGDQLRKLLMNEKAVIFNQF